MYKLTNKTLFECYYNLDEKSEQYNKDFSYMCVSLCDNKINVYKKSRWNSSYDINETYDI